MTYYCTFFVRADAEAAAVDIFRSSALQNLVFEDSQSPANSERAKRLSRAGFVTRNDLPRYRWCLDTRDVTDIDEIDPFVHVSWLLSQLKPGVMLAEARRRGIESSLSFFWGGGGTGGGPFISPALASLLARHEIGLDVGFYCEAPAASRATMN